MPKPDDVHSDEIGRFEHSFIILLVRDFFFALLLVSAIELGIRYLILEYEFEHDGRETTAIAAERLASDVKDLMLNSGGPVAARTLYPILKRNHDARGLVIAVEPSPLTVSSIRKIFKYTPEGIPALWPDGRHHAVAVDIRAEKFCLRCHSAAKVGDVLGRVTVRNYFSTHLGRWLQDAQLTGALSVGDIVLRAFILFFLLRIRMEGLLSLQAVISVLSRAGSDISHRAKIKSKDEFGALARDLNLFLDRLNHIVDDMCRVLEKVGMLNTRLSRVHGNLAAQYGDLESGLDKLSRQAFSAQRGEPLLSREWYESLTTIMAALRLMLQDREGYGEFEVKLRELQGQFENATRRAAALFDSHAQLGASLADATANLRGFSRSLGEMAVLETEMEAIAELGQTMVDRLRHSKDGDQEQGG